VFSLNVFKLIATSVEKKSPGQEKTYRTVNNWAAVATAENNLLIRWGIEGDSQRSRRDPMKVAQYEVLGRLF
jgi:hypothetical protein